MTRAFIEKSVENIDPNKTWFRLYLNESSESKEAFNLLANELFYVTTLRVSGLAKPELKIGAYVYRGIKEITEIVDSLREKYSK